MECWLRDDDDLKIGSNFAAAMVVCLCPYTRVILENKTTKQKDARAFIFLLFLG
jgi:hypothetical protein